MRKTIVAAAFAAAAFTLPSTAVAAPAVLIVDLDKVLTDCTACRAATTTIQGQVQQGQSRAQALENQLKPEAAALDAAVKALGGKAPDAALRTRVTAFQTKQQAAQTELANRQRSIESTQSNVQQQIANRVVLISEQVRARRQADVVMGKNATLASNPASDITGEVLAALNQQLPSVSVTPLPQQARPAGR
ncbi:MAG: OmpH family outer membrane protein [Sphingomonas bacterium]|nr:OmpH family outer membrane protein [Sphingomonas bacterium]